MPYLIDTNEIIPYLNQQPEAQALIRLLIPARIAISVITYMEVYQRVYHPDVPPHFIHDLKQFTAVAPILDVTPAIGERCAQIREQLRQQSKQFRQRALDLVIAATAVERGLTLVTRNTKDFADIPGIVLYDYQSLP